MPRFIVRVAVQRRYTKYISLAASEVSDVEDVKHQALNTSPPDPYASDWIVEHLTPVAIDREPRLDKDQWNCIIGASLVGRRPMAIRAKNEQEAILLAEKASDQFRDDMFSYCASGNWNSHGQDMQIEGIRREDGPKRPRSKFDVDIARLIAPDTGLYPIHLDQGFEILRWMIATSKNYQQKCTYHTQTLTHLLGGEGNSNFAPVTSKADLIERIRAGVLGQAYSFYQTWRDDHGIHPNAKLTIKALHHGPNVSHVTSCRSGQHPTGIEGILEDIGQLSPGMKLRKSLNYIHADAINILNVGVIVRESGFALRMKYGVDHSCWTHDLAITRGNETFWETIDRGIALFLDLVPDFAQQCQIKRQSKWKLAA